MDVYLYNYYLFQRNKFDYNIQDLYFLLKLMDDTRKAIIEGRFKEFKKEFIRNYMMGKEHEWIRGEKLF